MTQEAYIKKILDFFIYDLVDFIFGFGQVLFTPLREVYTEYLPPVFQLEFFQPIIDLIGDFSFIGFISVGSICAILIAKLVYQFIPG